MAKMKVVTYENLVNYDTKIKNLISTEDAKSIKVASIDGYTLKLYKVENPTESTVADIEIALPKTDLTAINNAIATLNGDESTDGSVKKTVKDAVNALEVKVGDISTLTTTEKGSVVGAVNELKTSISTAQTASEVTIDTSVTTEGMSKSYTFKQNGATLGVVDVPRDMVVESGVVEVDPDGKPAGTYLVLTLANATSEKVYINVGTLVDIYVAEASATQIQLNINSSTREISATVVAASIGTTELANNAIVTEKIADGNVTYAKLATDVINAFDASGAASTAETNAKKYADNLNASMNTRVTTIEGLVGEGITSITEDEINALFA